MGNKVVTWSACFWLWILQIQALTLPSNLVFHHDIFQRLPVSTVAKKSICGAKFTKSAQERSPHIANWENCCHKLVGGIPTPLKKMSSSVGMMTFPIYGKIKFMFQTTNQQMSGSSFATSNNPAIQGQPTEGKFLLSGRLGTSMANLRYRDIPCKMTQL